MRNKKIIIRLSKAEYDKLQVQKESEGFSSLSALVRSKCFGPAYYVQLNDKLSNIANSIEKLYIQK